MENRKRLFEILTDMHRVHKADKKRLTEYLEKKECYLTTTNKFPNGGPDTIVSHEFEARNQIFGGLNALSLYKDGTIRFKAYEKMNDEEAFEIFDLFIHNANVMGS
jgi:hypothetical protein